MAKDDLHAPPPPAQAQTPRGVNHLVLNVRDLDVSHRFWTEIMGFHCVAQLKSIPGRTRPKMRFYSGVNDHGDVSHHDLALCEVPKSATPDGDPERWDLMPSHVGLNHVAIMWPDRESWLKQLAFLQSKGVTFHRRVNHGMTHSVYISDPGRSRDRGAVRAAARGVGARHRRSPELRRDAPHRGRRVAHRQDGQPRLRRRHPRAGHPRPGAAPERPTEGRGRPGFAGRTSAGAGGPSRPPISLEPQEFLQGGEDGVGVVLVQRVDGPRNLHEAAVRQLPPHPLRHVAVEHGAAPPRAAPGSAG